MWVFDATPLIYLSKVDRLSLVQHLERSCVIPEPVYAEVVETGLEEGSPDARRLERGVEDTLFDVVGVDRTPLVARLESNDSLSVGDIAVLACADTHDGVAVMDETYGRDVGAAEGIETRGTTFLVLTLASQEPISADDGRSIIDSMIDEGWYCSPDVYTRIIQELDGAME